MKKWNMVFYKFTTLDIKYIIRTAKMYHQKIYLYCTCIYEYIQGVPKTYTSDSIP